MTQQEADRDLAEFVALVFVAGVFLIGSGVFLSWSIDAYKFFSRMAKKKRIQRRKIRQLQRAFSDRRPKPRMPWEVTSYDV